MFLILSMDGYEESRQVCEPEIIYISFIPDPIE